MNTEEIERVLRRVCGKNFDGVFSADTLPAKPHLLVVNTDDSHSPGRHWVKNDYGEYFDSFGQPPTANFERYLNRHCQSWTFIRRQLQSVVSRFCGHYCIQIVTGIEVYSESNFPKLREYCPSAEGTRAIFPQLREIRLTIDR